MQTKENLERDCGKDCHARGLNRRMPWIIVDDEAYKGRLMTMIGVTG